jgi:hypothetical protein
MDKGIMKKLMKKNYKSEDFKRGKNNVSKNRHRGIIKTKAKKELEGEYVDEIFN